MNTLKSAALVVILTGVLVGVYVTLYKPAVTPPPGMTQQQLDELGPPLIEEEGAADHDHFHGATARDHRPARDQMPLAASDSLLYGPGVVPPTGSDFGESSPADPPIRPEGRPLSHSEPLADDRAAAGNVYSFPLPGETSAASAAVSPPAPYDAAAVARRLAQHNFKLDWEQAKRQVDEGQFRAALATLTPHYGHADLPPDHQAELVAWLDALAAKVIYSREHLLARPYKVRGSQERMIDVARHFGVTAQLLQNINSAVVNNPDVMLPGTVLKVVPGPFRAEVSLARSEITLFLGDLYAGRFPMARGDEPVSPGQYQVQQKQPNPTYVGSDGRTIAGNDPANPYGAISLNLGSQVRIHGSALIAASGKPRGCISLSPRDAEDLFSILGEGSIVVIK